MLYLAAAFVAPSLLDRGSPPGGLLAGTLAAMLSARGVVAGRPTRWTASGWSFSSRQDDVDLEVVVYLDGPRCFLRIAPPESDSLLTAILGKTSSPLPEPVHRLARQIQVAVEAIRGCDELHWRWDGPPRDDDPCYPPRPLVDAPGSGPYRSPG